MEVMTLSFSEPAVVKLPANEANLSGGKLAKTEVLEDIMNGTSLQKRMNSYIVK